MPSVLARSIASFALILASLAVPAHAADWKSQLPVFRIGLSGGENDADRLRRNECIKTQLSEKLGIPVELYPASDYSGVMQGLLAGQLDSVWVGASAYAGIYLQDPEAVEPIFVPLESDGSPGTYAIMYVRSSSDIHSLDDMKGKSLAFADPNSTTGYLVPKAEMEMQGIDLDTYFSRTGFAGGHEQATIAVLNEQYDAGVTWSSGQGKESEGFTRGNLRTMVDNGLLDMKDLRVVWKSSLIPNGPWVLRKAVPQEARDIVVEWMGSLHETDPKCYVEMSNGEGQGFKAVGHDFFANIVAMREREVKESR